MYVTFGAGFCLLPFVQDVEVCLQRIFPPKDFGNKSRVLEISDPIAVFSIFFLLFLMPLQNPYLHRKFRYQIRNLHEKLTIFKKKSISF